MGIRILLADDHQVVRHGLRTALEEEPGMDIVGEAENGRAAINEAKKHRPDVVLMDIHMPGLNGTEATRQILAACPDTRVIALSMHSNKRYVVGMLEAGAVGFLLKTCEFEELVQAVRSVMAGRSYLSPEVAGTVIQMAVNPSEKIDVPALSVLTAREREVVQLMAEGHGNRAIAEMLGVSEASVLTYRRQVMKKLNLHSVAELTKFAIREGLTSLDS